MKLNPDCTRAILLAVEDVCDMRHYFSSREDLNHIAGNFSKEEIIYHARQCYLNGMFYNYNMNIECEFTITDLSPKGHEFLANIREESVWKSVKDISSKIGSTSISTLFQISSAVITEFVKSYFQR